MARLNTAISWRDFFSIYTFQSEPDKMALTFSLRCGMLIVESWTVCLFFIYFANVPFTVACQTRVLESRSALFSLRAPRSWQISPYPKGGTSIVGKGRGVTVSRSWSIFLFCQKWLFREMWVTCHVNFYPPPFLLGYGERRLRRCSGPREHLEPRLSWWHWFSFAERPCGSCGSGPAGTWHRAGIQSLFLEPLR